MKGYTVMPGLTRHPVILKGRPLGDTVFHWIPAFAGMTMGGAGMTSDYPDFRDINTG